MSMRVTITQPNVYDSYGILMPSGSIKTVDNNFGASLVFANRATDTDGVLAAPTNKPFDITIETPIYPIAIPGTTSANIQAAIDSVSAAGGGIVQLPAGRIVLATTLQMRSSVKLKGVAPSLVYNTIPDSGLTTLVGSTGGTVLVPSSGIDAIAWNLGVLGVPATQTAFSQLGLTNISIEDIGFSGDLGGLWGIHAGNTNNASAWYSQFRNLYFTGFTNTAGGGISITNYQHCQFTGNYSFGNAWGQLHQIDVASASLAPGNSTYYDLYNCNPVGSGANAILSRSISFITTATTGGAADNNQFKFDRIQSNRFGGVTTTQAATMANATANITITDGTKFAVGLPVTFSATVNGFTINQVYFVVSVAANVIQVALTYGGAAIVATGNTAVNCVHQGFPCFEMIALSGSQQTNMVLDNLDVEGFGTCAAFFQNCAGVKVTFSQVPGIVQAPISMCTRGCAQVIYEAPQSISTDIDQNSSGNGKGVFFFGSRFGTNVGHMGHGIWLDTVSGKSSLSFGGQFNSASAADLTWDPATAGGFLAPRVSGIGGAPTKVISGSITITNLNLSYLNTTASAAMSVPTVTAANEGAELEFFNNTGSNQTIATDLTQLFSNVAGRTVLTLPDKASVKMRGMSLNGTRTWVLTGGSGTMTAGVITAPS